MPATINTTALPANAFANPMSLRTLGKDGAGCVFLDSEDKTFIGTMGDNPSLMLKLVRIDKDGSARRMAEPSIRWPIRLAPKDHAVTFANA